MTEPLQTPDLTICDREPITRLDRIQSFGFLIALANDWTVVRVSENIAQYFAIPAAQLLGSRLENWITKPALHEIRNRLTVVQTTGGERIFGLRLVKNLPEVDLSLHFVDGLLMIEGEASQKAERMEAASMVRAMVAHLGRAENDARFHSNAARQVLALTGFDRVMIYRFDEGGHGEVIAESTRAGMESFLGLHFPASDIPKQARALYLLNPFRIIADVHAPTIALLPPADRGVSPLDLSRSICRAVSPVHIEYLTNMGIGASLSISIVVGGQLWGLIACHAKAPRLPSFIMRTAAELYGSMYSMMLEGRLRTHTVEEEVRARALADRMIVTVAGDDSLLGNAMWLQDMIREVIDCDGVATYRSGQITRTGATPPEEQILPLVHHLNIAAASKVFATDNLASVHEPCAHTAQLAAGMLSIPVSRVPRDYIMLFRCEQLKEIRWGGDPSKVVEQSDDGFRISPRKSFAAFSQLSRGYSLPFNDRDLRIAEFIRVALIEVVLRNIEGASEERRQTAQRQELLIAELNHRVRNILSLIRSLISSTRTSAEDLASYVEMLNGRVQALSRAHDRVTRQNWGPAPLDLLFIDEIAAHDGVRDRLSIESDGLMLQPEAISTMALVVHELVTNACKHGALSDSGRVEVRVERKPGEGAFIRWKEIDGPKVKAPTRRGFGSVILERTVPYDLQGSARLDYLISGLEAEFFIAEQHLHSADRPSTQTVDPEAAPADEPQDAPGRPLDGAFVLLLEDNLLIAMEAEDILRQLGAAHVESVSTVSEARSTLARHACDFAMLDVSIGRGTSLELAKELASAAIPFLFATGYGSDLPQAIRDGKAVIIQKPYERDHLAQAVRQVMANKLAPA